MIEKAIAIVSLVKEVLEAVKGEKALMVQQYFLEYLLADEQKHEQCLKNTLYKRWNVPSWGINDFKRLARKC